MGSNPTSSANPTSKGIPHMVPYRVVVRCNAPSTRIQRSGGGGADSFGSLFPAGETMLVVDENGNVAVTQSAAILFF